MKRVLLAGIHHETNTFLRGLTRLDEWQTRRDKQVVSDGACASTIAGVVEVAREANWELFPSVHMSAMPGPLVADEVVESFWQSVSERLATMRRDLDGVFLVLHGAMISESIQDVEGEILERLRGLLREGEVPVGGVIDLHANFTARMARLADVLIAYRENPHTDAKDASMRAAWLLDRLMQTGERPATIWEQAPIMWPPTGTDTLQEPLRSLQTLAREIEQRDSGILSVNVIPGFALADVRDSGLSFSVITVSDPTVAAEKASCLRRLAEETRELGNVVGISIEEAIGRLRPTNGGPTVLVEPSDNIGAGAPGDGTALLKALVDNDIPNAAVIVNDPAAVQALLSVGIGGAKALEIGGKGSPLGGGPIRLRVELLRRSDGRFELEDAQSHLAAAVGAHVDMGPCAVVRHGGVRVLLTSRRTPPFDLGQLRSQGIVPEELNVVVVKAAVAHRRAYDPIAKVSYWVETPGPCSSDLRVLPYHRVRRPIYPLDT